MVMAVGAPIILLLYSYTHFEFDREAALINLEMLKVGAFERQARLMADPVQVTAFLLSFNALRISSILDFSLRIGMNLSFCYRLKRVIEVKIQQTIKRSSSSRRLSSNLNPTAQHQVPIWMTLPFIAFSCGVLVYAHMCTVSSAAACSKFTECVAFSHRITSVDSCPCIALIDVDPAPRTYDEWVNPPNATEKLKFLASSGDLRVLQLINRRLTEFPKELLGCRYLSHM